ncbi:hypothetical protein DM02DRAFT_237538 [Periconia macrospinosa]|uniref:Uncharacterized protein n=1 Tax=Periconia macrospinosa TaxID=97972 RepID=A0A2V1ECB6_9PLEO|nr:hypothetical protein DM02DRAFT_237538 [Periconia macrospinosa]
MLSCESGPFGRLLRRRRGAGRAWSSFFHRSMFLFWIFSTFIHFCCCCCRCCRALSCLFLSNQVRPLLFVAVSTCVSSWPCSA